jgi:polar amino acid transport system substrate-binding protein
MAENKKGYQKQVMALGLLVAGGMLSLQAQADQLADIKAAGVVKVATFDANPPFGSIDAKTHNIVGYDVDFAQALAKALGVKLELVATNPANRIPLLQSGKADLIVADITITPERAQVVDFSTPISSPDSSSWFRPNRPISWTTIAGRVLAR